MGKKILVLCMVIALLILLPVFSYADLPVGYTELEYIESSGTQYIDTGVIPSNSTSVSVDAQIGSNSTGYRYVLGTFDLLDGEYYRQFSISFYNSSSNRVLQGGFGSYTNDLAFDFSSRFTASLSKSSFMLDGSERAFSSSASLSSVTKNVFLFGTSRHGSSIVQSLTALKLYSCQFFENSSLIRDFIPCANPSGVVGLWDDVNSVFYDNDGSGTFIAGPVVVPPEPEYSISVSSDGNGSASSNVSTATAGTTVLLTATSDDGFVFSEWQVLQGDIDIVNNQFIMPSSNVSIKAVFVPDGAYSVTVQNDGFGTGSANPVRAQAGDRITLSAVPALGYEFDRWQVVSGSVNISNNQFIMPDSDVVVKALFKPIVYTITLNQGSNGSATVSQTTGIIGDVITLTATPDDLYSFSYWDVTQGGITVENNQFVMPASNVVLTPVFVKQTAVSSGYKYNSGVLSNRDTTARIVYDTVSFGEQPAGEYLINIYSYGQNYGVSFDIGVGSDITKSRKLPYTQSGGVTTALYTHSGGEMVLELNFTYYKSVLNSIYYFNNYGSFYEGTGIVSGEMFIASSGNYIFNIIDVTATPVGLANSEDYGIYAGIISFLKDKFDDLIAVFGSEEAEENVNQAADELNKEVEDLNNLGGQLEEQQTSLETQFESDFKVSDDITAQTSTFQGIYTGIFSSFGIFSIFIWLPVVLAVIKKLLRL